MGVNEQGHQILEFEVFGKDETLTKRGDKHRKGA